LLICRLKEQVSDLFYKPPTIFKLEIERGGHILLRRVFIATLMVVLLTFAVAAQAAGPVRLFIFYSDTCGHCQIVLNEVLPPLQAKYGSNLEVRGFEISTAANYEVMLKLEKR
jgi:hypothetical protein